MDTIWYLQIQVWPAGARLEIPHCTHGAAGPGWRANFCEYHTSDYRDAFGLPRSSVLRVSHAPQEFEYPEELCPPTHPVSSLLGGVGLHTHPLISFQTCRAGVTSRARASLLASSDQERVIASIPEKNNHCVATPCGVPHLFTFEASSGTGSVIDKAGGLHCCPIRAQPKCGTPHWQVWVTRIV